MRPCVAALEKFVPLAPLHQPHNLAPIRVAARARAAAAAGRVLRHGVPPRPAGGRAGVRAAEGDHRPRRAPLRLSRAVVRVHRAACCRAYDARAAAGRTIVLHLGNGASMCAIAAGASVASTMGFTAVDGLPMGTRCGSLDPGVILYLMDELRMDARAIEKLIYQQSGLLGVSGISSDMRTLRGERRDPRAKRGDRPVRLPDRARARLARGGARRPRCDRVHRRHRREQPRACARASARTRRGSASSSIAAANAGERPAHQHRRRAASPRG